MLSTLHHRGRSRARAGLTVVEVVVALSVLVVAVSIFCQMLVSTARMRTMNRESLLAADAARVALERLRNVPFEQVWRLHNENPADDPGGAGTAPGARFAVEGLDALDGAPGGTVGRYVFPTRVIEGLQGTGLGGVQLGGGKAAKSGSSGGTGAVTSYELREDLQDASLGLPRDLDGDNVIDAEDHALDYLVLPVRIELEWQSASGLRRFSITSQLTDFRREGDA